jgi:hypothetical protein
MNKTKITKLLVIMAIPILLLMTPLTAKAAEIKGDIFSVNEYDYTITKTATLTTKGNVSIKINQSMRESVEIIKIPETIQYNNLKYQVTTIGQSGFYNCTNLTKVILPNSVTSVGSSAFKKCSELTIIVVPDKVKNINSNAFAYCSSQLVFYCSKDSVAYNFAKSYYINYKTVIFQADNTILNQDSKLIIVGDSRTNNMSKWVTTSVTTQFVAESGKGYVWFVDMGIDRVNAIAKPGDTIIIWLGVNDYFSSTLGGDTWTVYANKINSLAANEWADCKIRYAAVGYVDRAKHITYYGTDKRTNVTALTSGNKIQGINEFNEKLKESLSSNITWIETFEIIGINDNDTEVTSNSIWLTRANGLKDGLHYGKVKTQQIYDYFVKETR